MLDDGLKNLKAAIELQRTDVVREILSMFESDEVADHDLSPESLLNTLCCDEGTVLHLATKAGHTDIIRTLLAAGADPTQLNKDHETPVAMAQVSQQVLATYVAELFQCVAQSNYTRAQLFINAGLDVNSVDSEITQNTPLHWAATYGDEKIVRLLIGRGALVNVMNAEGLTPLHDAVQRNDIKIVEILLEAGSNPDMRVKEGKHAGKNTMDMAQDNPSLLNVLKNYTNHSGSEGSRSSHPGGPRSRTDSTDQEEPISPTPDTPTSNGPNLPLSNGLPNNTEFNPEELKMQNNLVSAFTDQLRLSKQPPKPVAPIQSRLSQLWPHPQKTQILNGKPFVPTETLHVFITTQCSTVSVHELLSAWQTRHSYLTQLGYNLHVEPLPATCNLSASNLQCVLCQVNRKLFSRDESYRITVKQKQIKIIASDTSGLNYAISTLLQLLRLFKEGIPALTIHDWPSLKNRGVLLDLSQGRRPLLESIKWIIDILAQLKINQVHLYTRFRVTEEPQWQFCYSRSELLSLDTYCKSLCVTLVPVLDVSPKVAYEDLMKLHSSFQEFLACFTHTEAVHLGPRLSSFLPDTSDMEVLSSVDTSLLLPVPTNHSLQLCAFLFHEQQDALQRLPLNVTLMEYGFQATYEFEDLAQVYSENSVPFCLCPGTSAWNSIAGCPEAAVSNILNAAKAANAHDALGMVICDWSGVGHMTHQCVSWPGFITGAGLAWNTATQGNFLHSHLAELLNRHVFYDEGLVTGEVVIELGRAETYMLRCARNQAGTDSSNLPAEHGSTLYKLLSHPDHVALEHLTLEICQKAMRHIRKCLGELSKARMYCIRGSQVLSELQLTADLLLSACRVGRALVGNGRNPSANKSGYSVVNLGVANLNATTRTDLANRLLGMIEQYRSVWLAGNQPQGLQESLLVLSTMLKQYLPDGTPNETT